MSSILDQPSPVHGGSAPNLLDLFCCAGGAGFGYRQAGFHVTGIDIKPQPRYAGDLFIQDDALNYLAMFGRHYDVIHASPPCQAYTPLRALSPTKDYPDLIPVTREILRDVGRPYVIENVMSAPLLGGIVLCGGMFGLRTYRHRRFEPSQDVWLHPRGHPPHLTPTATKRRRERWAQGWHVSITGDVGTYLGPAAMGIDWMTGNELCEAIPPAYTMFVGDQLMAQFLEGAA